jgi:hypothetical protein
MSSVVRILIVFICLWGGICLQHVTVSHGNGLLHIKDISPQG